VDIDPVSVGATTLQQAADNLETIRLAAITELDTDRAKLIKAQNDNALLQAQITALTAILQQNGWLP
jgi:DNA anti-recombination protein RmuC